MAIRFTILDELEIPYEDCWEDNPMELMARAYKKADELRDILDKSETLTDLELRFKSNALKNVEARERAKELVDSINNILLGETPEVVANFLALLPETTSLANSIVQSMGVREALTETTLPKPVAAKLYAGLRSWQEQYVKLGNSDFIQIVKNMPAKEKIRMIPAKPGNYSPKKHGMKLYHYILDGNDWYSPFMVAKELNLEIPTNARWADIHTILVELDNDDLEIEELS